MSKDILGSLVRVLVTVPEGRLGLVRDFANKLAGPDGDTWVQQGKLFFRKEPCWVNDQVAQAAESEPTEKFALLVDLGIITVPDDYVHEKRLTTFGKQNRKKFCYYNDEITDKNFPNPTRVLKPGQTLRVRAFKQVVGGTTTSEERMAFLATQKAIHTGAQGASLVFDQKRDQLPKGKWYASFDEKDRLWADAGGDHGVPHVGCHSGGDFLFGLGYFGDVWRDDFAFLCFCDVE